MCPVGGLGRGGGQRGLPGAGAHAVSAQGLPQGRGQREGGSRGPLRGEARWQRGFPRGLCLPGLETEQRANISGQNGARAGAQLPAWRGPGRDRQPTGHPHHHEPVAHLRRPGRDAAPPGPPDLALLGSLGIQGRFPLPRHVAPQVCLHRGPPGGASTRCLQAGLGQGRACGLQQLLAQYGTKLALAQSLAQRRPLLLRQRLAEGIGQLGLHGTVHLRAHLSLQQRLGHRGARLPPVQGLQQCHAQHARGQGLLGECLAQVRWAILRAQQRGQLGTERGHLRGAHFILARGGRWHPW